MLGQSSSELSCLLLKASWEGRNQSLHQLASADQIHCRPNAYETLLLVIRKKKTNHLLYYAGQVCLLSSISWREKSSMWCFDLARYAVHCCRRKGFLTHKILVVLRFCFIKQHLQHVCEKWKRLKQNADMFKNCSN